VAGRGILYNVVGSWDVYLKAAVRSAQSVKAAMPDTPIAVVGDRVIDGPFDHHISVSEADGYRAKILGARLTPFDQTVMLDVDTYVLADLAELFELLAVFDMALAHAPIRISTPLDDVPKAFPEFNTGVIVYRRSPLVDAVLDDWLKEYDGLAGLDTPTWDQPSFRRVAYRTEALRIATLTPEFNQRFKMAGYLNQPVRILHGWPDTRPRDFDYRKVADALETPLSGVDHWAVFSGRRVFDRSGRQVATFRPPWSRVRRVTRPIRSIAREVRTRVRPHATRL